MDALQILAGNARKVSAVRFERLEDDDTRPDANGVAFFPKVMKRSRPRDNDFDRPYSDEDRLQPAAEENGSARFHDDENIFVTEKEGSTNTGIVEDHVDSRD